MIYFQGILTKTYQRATRYFQHTSKWQAIFLKKFRLDFSSEIVIQIREQEDYFCKDLVYYSKPPLAECRLRLGWLFKKTGIWKWGKSHRVIIYHVISKGYKVLSMVYSTMPKERILNIYECIVFRKQPRRPNWSILAEFI